MCSIEHMSLLDMGLWELGDIMMLLAASSA